MYVRVVVAWLLGAAAVALAVAASVWALRAIDDVESAIYFGTGELAVWIGALCLVYLAVGVTARVREIRALRRRGRTPGALATWTLRDRHDDGDEFVLRRDGSPVATVLPSPDPGSVAAGSRVCGDGRELCIHGRGDDRRVVADAAGRTVAQVDPAVQYYGHHRAEIGDTWALLGPLRIVPRTWRAVDDTGAVRTIRFGHPEVVAVDLDADLDPVVLAAVLWVLVCDRQVRLETNHTG